MTRAEKLALIADYWRAQGQHAWDYVDDALITSPMQVDHGAACRAEAARFADVFESGDLSAIGQMIEDRVIANHLAKAEEWKAEQRSAA